jgi:hypothetical protein
MAAGQVAQYSIGVFTAPNNGDDLDASVVEGNDNTIVTTYNEHDADPTIHVQSSLLANRPAPGTAQRVWVTTDGYRIYLDTGVAWQELAYLQNPGGIMKGDLLFTDALYDIGKSGATRPRDGFFSRDVKVGGTLIVTGAATLNFGLDVVNGLSVNTNSIVGSAAVQARAHYVTVGAYAGGGLPTGAIATRIGPSAGFLYFGDQGASLDYGSTTAGRFTFANGGVVAPWFLPTDRAFANIAAGAIQQGPVFGTVITARGGTTNDFILNSASGNILTVGPGGANIGLYAAGSLMMQVTTLNVGYGVPILFFTDNAVDIGASGANRPRNGYFAGTVSQASSRALKKQIRPTRLNALELVRDIDIVDFRYKADPDRKKIGFIAEDTPEILTGAAHKEFDLSNGIGLSFRAIQQLLTRVEQLERHAA